MLTRHRGGLEAVAQALLTRETISGTEVGELIAGALNGNADNGTSPAPTPSAPSPWSTPSPKR